MCNAKSYSESQVMSLPRKLIWIYSLPNNISQICSRSSFYQQILIIKINYRRGSVNFPRNSPEIDFKRHETPENIDTVNSRRNLFTKSVNAFFTPNISSEIRLRGREDLGETNHQWICFIHPRVIVACNLLHHSVIAQTSIECIRCCLSCNSVFAIARL